MHSLIQPVLGRVIADERTGRHSFRAERSRRPERPPKTPIRGRVAFATGRLARRIDHEMARRATV
jgi:hypothetical protein